MSRPLPPLDLPVVLGESIRCLVLLELVVTVICVAFVADRLRKTMPRRVHLLFQAGAALACGVAAGVVSNQLTVPPTTGIYLTAVGATVCAGLAVAAAVAEYRDPH